MQDILLTIVKVLIVLQLVILGILLFARQSYCIRLRKLEKKTSFNKEEKEEYEELSEQVSNCTKFLTGALLSVLIMVILIFVVL